MMNIRHALIGFATLGSLLATACGGTPPTAATATNVPSASASSTSTPTASPTPTPALPLPAGEAIPAIVAQVIGGVTGKQVAALMPLVAYQSLGCTTAQGAGGPPKCKAGEAQGTVAKVFMTGRCEPEWTADAEKAITDALNGAGSLYAVAKINPAPPSHDPIWPKGDTVIVYRGSAPTSPATYFVLNGDKIVRAHLVCDASVAEDSVIKRLEGTAYLIAPTAAAR